MDADFAGGWDPDDALNADKVYTCTGYVNCWMSGLLAIQASNRNCTFNCGGQVYCLIIGSEGDYSNDKFDERHECYLSSLSSSTQIYFEGLRG